MKKILTPKLLLITLFFIVFNIQQSCKEEIGEDIEHITSQLDVLPNENQVDYSPEDGSTVKVNPPPFIWLPVKKDMTYPTDYVDYNGPRDKIWNPINDNYKYTLQISKDKNFKSGVITKKGIEISTFSLDKALKPGEWYWRYGVENGKTIYSQYRKFIVPSDVKIWPFPSNINKVISSIPKTRPRLFILKEELDTFRNRALYGDLKEIVSEIKSDIEKFIGEELPAESKWVKGLGPEFGENSWTLIYQANIPSIDLAESFGLVYLLTGEKKYGEESRRRVVHFLGWDPDGPTSDRSHNETNYRIVDQCSRAYDWVYELFTSEERIMIQKSMKRRVEQLYDRLKYRSDRPYHVYNRGSHEERITGFIGQAAICFADEWKETADWLKYALTIHWNLYPAWAKEDGGWHQGPSYWSGYQTKVLHFITALKKASNIDLMQKDFFRNTPYYILYSNPPYAKRSPFGDFAYNPPGNAIGALMYNYSSLLNDPYLRWYSDFMGSGQGKNILGVLLKNDEIKGKAPVDLPQTRYFPGIGLVSIHTNFGIAEDDIHFLFQSDPYGGVSHGHPHQNAFIIEAFGEALAITTGYRPWYGSPHHINWTKQTKSSNCITIDGGKGQGNVALAKGEILTFENRDIYDYILGDATQAYLGLLKKYQRHVIHIRPGIFILYDDLEAPEPVIFEWWLHALSKMKINESDKSILISERDVCLKVNLLHSGKLNFDQFTGFPDPPEVVGEKGLDYTNNWHLTVSSSLKSEKERFIAVLVPFKKEKEPEISISKLTEDINKVSFDLAIDENVYNISFVPSVNVIKK